MSEAQPALVRFLRAAPHVHRDLLTTLSNDAAFVSDAARHGLAAVVDREFQLARVAPGPAIAPTLRKHALQSIQYAMRTQKLTHQAIDALAKAGVVSILLKGYALASRIYDDAMLRVSTDVDILVDRDDLNAACAAIETLGLKPEVDADEYYPPEYRHHLSFHGPAGLVEIHFRPVGNFEPWEGAAFSQRSIAATLDGKPVRLLRPEDEFVYLALHAAQHLFFRLSWIYDLKLFVTAYPNLDWNQVVMAANESQTPALAACAFDVARRSVGLEIPMHVTQTLRLSMSQRIATENLLSTHQLVASRLSQHRAVWAALKFVLADNRREFLRFAARRGVWVVQKRLSTPPQQSAHNQRDR